MNKEEMQQAIKIIQEPITVNSIEYKYFDQENYDKLVSVYENCRWFIDNTEQIIQNCEYQQKQIEHLQNLIDKATDYYLKELSQSVHMDDVAVEMFNLLEESKR